MLPISPQNSPTNCRSGPTGYSGRWHEDGDPSIAPSARNQHAKGLMNNERQQILRRVGLALIVFGCLDIGVTIYCIMRD
jgi:uncharacterized protein YjeT (DUF2065 family)